MAGGAQFYIAVPAALGAAASFGLTGVLQHHATRLVPKHRALRPSLLFDLIQQPIWVASVAANIAGIVLQVVALSFGPLLLVQPLLVMGLFFAVLVGSALARRRPDRALLLGAGCCVLGLAAFLLVARPTGGGGVLTVDEVLPLTVGLGITLLVCLSIASRTGGEPRALALALACGVLYGVTAGLIKVVVEQFGAGLLAPFQHWTFYAVCIIGPIGFLLNQNAYQAEAVAAPALAVITTTDPLIGIGIGRLWLGENIRTGAAAVVGEVLALGVMAAGIVALAHRAPHVQSQAQPETIPGESSYDWLSRLLHPGRS